MPHDTLTPDLASRRAKLWLTASSLILLLAICAFVWQFAPEIEKKLGQLSHNTELLQRKTLLHRQIKELVDAEETANQMALTRARATLFRQFNAYSGKVPRFAEEIAGFKNRLSIAAKSATDSAKNTREADKFISDVFEKEVVTHQQMSKDLQKIILQFQRDFNANRDRLVTNAARRIHEADLPDSQYELSELTLRKRIVKQIALEKSALHDTTADITADAYSGQGIAEESTQTLNAQIARVGVSNLALEVIVKAGTAVGLAVGLGIGYIADQWLSNRLQKKIISSTRKALLSMRDDIWGHPDKGMKAVMEHAIQHQRNISLNALEKVVAGEI